LARRSADPGLAEVPVLLVTAVHNPDIRAEQLDVHGWIAKPFEIEQAVEAVLSYCGMRGTTVAPKPLTGSRWLSPPNRLRRRSSEFISPRQI
jgi:hypothetical protein